MIDGLPHEIELGGQECGIVQAQADGDDIGLRTQNRFEPCGATAGWRPTAAGQMSATTGEEAHAVRSEVHLAPSQALADQGGPPIARMSDSPPSGSDGVAQKDGGGEGLRARYGEHASTIGRSGIGREESLNLCRRTSRTQNDIMYIIGAMGMRGVAVR